MTMIIITITISITIVIINIIIIIVVAFFTVSIQCSLGLLIISKDQVMTHDLRSPGNSSKALRCRAKQVFESLGSW